MRMQPLDIRTMVIQIRGYLFFFLAIIYLAHAIFGWFSEQFIIGTALLTFLVSLPSMNRLPLIMSIVMIGSGQILFIVYNGEWSYWREALMQNLPFVTLFVSMPLLSIPLRSGGYEEYISQIIKRFFKKQTAVYAAIAGCSMVLTAFMNIGSMRVMGELFARGIEQKKDMYAKAMVQGFSMSVLLSPYIAGVAIVLYLLDVPLIPFVFYGLLVVVMGLFISIGLFHFEAKTQKTHLGEISITKDFEEDDRESQLKTTKGYQLALAFIGLFAAVIFIEDWLRINLIVVISLIALTYPLLWLLMIRRFNVLPKFLTQYQKEVLPNLHNESILIIGAAFFSKMVQLSAVPDYLSQWFNWVTGYSLFLTVFVILLVIVLLSVVGIHQILPITILAISIPSENIGLHPMLLALTLTIGWAMAVQVSPITALSILTTKMFHVSPWQLGRWNWKFVSLMILSTTALLNLLNLLVTSG